MKWAQANLMNHLTPRPNHRDEVPYFVYLLDKSLADYLAGDISLDMLSRDIEGFAEAIWNTYDGRFSWVSMLEDLYWNASIPYFSEETISDERLESIRRCILHLRTALAHWWAENAPSWE